MLEIFDKLGYKNKNVKLVDMNFTHKLTGIPIGDAPCDEYEFIGNPATDKPYTLYEIQQVFQRIFRKRGHTPIKRYPILAKRWRDDVFLVGASIFCFGLGLLPVWLNRMTNPLEIELTFCSFK